MHFSFLILLGAAVSAILAHPGHHEALNYNEITRRAGLSKRCEPAAAAMNKKRWIKHNERRSLAARSNTTVVINDSRNDLALLKTEKQPKTIAYFRSGRGIRAGEDILAFGYPFQSVLSDELKGTKGMVNALSGFNNDSRFMQISAPVQPGNSGGPLLDNVGNIVGISVSGIGLRKLSAGLNFFIPIIDGLEWLNVKVKAP